jgi:hypothetical protein
MDSISFRQYLNGIKQQLEPALDQPPKCIIEYDISKFAHITVDSKVVQLNPKDKLVVEWSVPKENAKSIVAVTIQRKNSQTTPLTPQDIAVFEPTSSKWLLRHTSSSKYINRARAFK